MHPTVSRHLARLDEREHLFVLAGHNAPRRAMRSDHVNPRPMRILGRLSDTPAEVINEIGETLIQTRLPVALIPRPYPREETAEVHDYHDTRTGVLASTLAGRAPGYTSLGFPDPRRLQPTPSATDLTAADPLAAASRPVAARGQGGLSYPHRHDVGIVSFHGCRRR